jgi:hypothetical protein
MWIDVLFAFRYQAEIRKIAAGFGEISAATW